MARRFGIHVSAACSVVVVFACSSGTVSNGGYGYQPTADGGSGGQGGSGGGTGGKDAGASPSADGSSSGGASGDGSSAGGAADAGFDGGGPPDGSVSAALAFGDACGAAPAEACRPGLACVSGHCAFSHQGALDTPCVAAGECASGLICSLGRCAEAGAGAAGASCTTDVDCQSGLRCGIVGFGASCVPEGNADLGQPCTVSSDCFAGLLCAPSAGGAGFACAPIPTSGVGAGIPFGLPTPPKIQCDAPSTGRVDAYFEVPGAQGTTAGADFFRLPFPNDARVTGGKIDLDGFPTPGATFLGYDPVKVYVDAIVANESAWGAYPTVLFRFSGPVDFKTLTPVAGQPSPVQFLDITDPKNPGNGGAEWSYSGANGKYICHDWLGVRRPAGEPLEPGHVYTVYIASSARDTNGLAVNRSPELAALLASSAPSDPGLAGAYAAYKPLRDYLAAQSIAESTILDASVFTVGSVRSEMAALASAATTAAPPTATDWVLCDGTATSPCPDATGSRACGAPSAEYSEYHALVSLPIFQKGTEPYADTGGDIDTSGPVRREDVCVALTVPKGTMPSAGWPVVVFGHGTGGSFRDAVRPEVAGALSTAPVPMATLGFDEVEHGPRRGGSTASPNALFFNFKNPSAARGNPLQGAADVVSMGRFAASLSVAGSVTGGSAVTTNPNAVLYFGHSQGSMHGSLGLPYTNAYRAAVLSGNGASLAHALLTKTSPDNVAQAVPFVLGGDFDGSGKLFGGEDHPVLTLLDQWIGPADPLNFARGTARRLEPGILPKSVFQTYGLKDTYSPPLTLQMYALAAGLPLAAHDSSVATPDAFGLAEQPVPLSGNFAAGGRTVTLAVREYQNAAGKDGHFVVFDVASANADAVRFLSMAAAGNVPQIGN